MKEEEDVMAIQQIERAPAQATEPVGSIGTTFHLWRENKELLLAGVTLVALLIGWVGGSLTGALPAWAVTAAALVAFGAGGYSGLMGAIEQAKEGKLDIDFLMIAAALGAALIGEWEEGALLLFLFTLSGALEEFAMDRTRRATAHAGQLRRWLICGLMWRWCVAMGLR
jgi:Zn2+/Cd2+-exporting ATPase